MHALSIVVGSQCWRLLFKSEDAAKKAFSAIDENSSVVRIEDDYGQTAVIHTSVCPGFMLEDMDKSKFAYIETALHNARTNLDANAQASADPKLRANRQGPSVISPFNGGRLS
jgi:hypothetical protein